MDRLSGKKKFRFQILLIIPAKWFLIMVRDIMLKGSGLLYLWKETLILVVITLVYIGASLKKFNVRL